MATYSASVNNQLASTDKEEEAHRRQTHPVCARYRRRRGAMVFRNLGDLQSHRRPDRRIVHAHRAAGSSRGRNAAPRPARGPRVFLRARRRANVLPRRRSTHTSPRRLFRSHPQGAPHAFEVVSETARFLDLTTPQHEYFMRAAGEPAQGRVLPPAGPPDMEKVGAAAREYGVEILGPPHGAHDA